MLKRTEGIVLRTVPFGEADLIVTYITPDFGILKVFAKSPRKFKSRFGSSLEPLTNSKISFWGKEDSPLPKLTQSDIIHPFQSIREHLKSFLKVSELIELTISFMPERDANRRIYSLLLQTLQVVENNQIVTNAFNNHAMTDENCGVSPRLPGKMPDLFLQQNLIINHYKIKFLEFAGYAPKLDACARCAKNGYTFYISQGSILCELCAKGIDSPIKLSPAVTKLYHDLLAWDTTKINRIRPSEKLLSELSDLLNLHIKYILSKPLKSSTFVHLISG